MDRVVSTLVTAGAFNVPSPFSPAQTRPKNLGIRDTPLLAPSSAQIAFFDLIRVEGRR